ncbi:hypothetical protein Tco_1279103 [Tanacetum coccineum]
MREVFNQMETKNVVLHANNLPSVNLVLVSLKKDNDHLIKLLISQDLVHTQMNMLATLHDYKFMKQSYLDEYEENLKLKTELAKKNDWVEKLVFDELSKRCSRLENHSQLKAKDVSISRLRDHINTLKGKSVSENGPSTNKPDVITPGMFKLDIEPIPSTLKNNWEAHETYLRKIKESTDTLHGIV